MQGISDHLMNGESRGKQPRPMEDGNWVCDDLACNNVNYPRRTECNKCGKRRGALGDAIVKAYIESLKIARGEMLPHSSVMSQGVGGERLGMTRGIITHSESQQAIISSTSSLTNELEPWMGGGYEQTPSFASHYITGDGGLSGRRSTLSAATEGKRLAEQLVASFAASTDPVGDAGECLASAALWLQTMKSRMQTRDGGNLSSTTLGVSGITPTSTINNSVSLLTPPLGSNSGGGGLPITSPTPSYTTGGMLGNFGPRGTSNLGYFPVQRSILPRPNLRFEDYKDRPSDFLREFGDPAAVSATAMGNGQRPESGVNGNWECEDCKNVNFPRRTNCFQCNKKRGPKGEEIVRKYVRNLMEDIGVVR